MYIKDIMRIRLATTDDIGKISRLYYQSYGADYPDPVTKSIHLMEQAIQEKNSFWFICEIGNRVTSAVIYKYDPDNLLAKVYGGVVDINDRGDNQLKKIMEFGLNYLQENTDGVEIVYATTRTIHKAAQILTEKMGYKKLGIFPNAHKTNTYETHCLTALYINKALEKRFTDYKIHHEAENLVNIVKGELELPDFKTIVPSNPSKSFISPETVEIIDAENFVQNRFKRLKEGGKLQFMFYPFTLPNYMVVTPDQSVELFLSISSTDGHCSIIGGKLKSNICFTTLLLKTCDLLRARGVRYVEAIMRARHPKRLSSVIAAKFIPCAFFPALQLEDGKRYDYYVLSRSFEIFDFQNIQLQGVNLKYLEEYFKSWKKISLDPKILPNV